LPLATAASTRSRSPCSAGRWSVHPPVMSLTFDGTTSGERRTQSAHSLTLRKPRRDICRGAVHILHAHLRPHVRLVAAGMPRLPGRHSGERASASPRRSENACVAHLWIHYCEHHTTAHTESSVAACKHLRSACLQRMATILGVNAQQFGRRIGHRQKAKSNRQLDGLPDTLRTRPPHRAWRSPACTRSWRSGRRSRRRRDASPSS
jgi:hypothetical protein